MRACVRACVHHVDCGCTASLGFGVSGHTYIRTYMHIAHVRI